MEGEQDSVFQTQLLADGVILIAKDSRIFGERMNQLTFYKNFNLETVESKYLRGLRDFDKKYTLAVSLSQSSRPNVAFFVTSERSLDYQIVKRAFAEAVDLAMSLLPSGPTRAAFRTRSSCHSFYDVSCTGTYCMNCSNGKVDINAQEVVMFCGNVMKFVRTFLQMNGKPNYVCNFAIYELGQSMPFVQFAEMTSSQFCIEYADDMVLHVARDYKKEKCCLLWKADALLNNHSLQGQKTFFSTMMTLGHGNVTFDRTKVSGYAAVYENGLHYATLKFYTDTFKTIHRTGEGTDRDQRWKQPAVEDVLTTVSCSYGEPKRGESSVVQVRGESKGVRNPKAALASLKTVEALFSDLEGDDGNVARFEAILVLPRIRDNELTADTIWQKFRVEFENILGSVGVEEGWISQFDFKTFLEQGSRTIMAATHTLKSIMETTIAKRAQGNILGSIPDIVAIQTAVVCEQIISFCLYGKLNYYDRNCGRKYHSTDLISALNLKSGVYKTMPVDGNPFHGLELCGTQVEVVEKAVEKVVRKVVENGFQYVVENRKIFELKWLGPIYVKDTIWSSLSAQTSDADARVLNQLLQDIHRNKINNVNNDPKTCCERIGEIIWNAINSYAYSELYAGHMERDIEALITRSTVWNSMNILFVNSDTLINELFERPEGFEQRCLALYIRELRDQLEPLVCKDLRQELAKFVDVKIYRSKSLGILYPVRRGSNSRILAVLPFHGSPEDSYEVSSPESYYAIGPKQDGVKRLYNHAYKWRKGEDCNLDALHTILQHTIGRPRVNAECMYDTYYFDVDDVLVKYDDMVCSV